MIDGLQGKSCKPCEGGMASLSGQQVNQYLEAIPGWVVSSDGKSISKTFTMKNFLAAVRLIDAIAELAEREGHHPDLHLTNYRKLRVELSTHAIGGLSENDFILASKIEMLPKELK